jgi:hypothetical protein
MSFQKIIVYASIFASTFNICMNANAQQTQAEKEIYAQLSKDERRVLDFFGENDLAFSEWQDYLIYLRVEENFFRAALLDRCSSLRKVTPDQTSFDPKIHTTLLELTKKTKHWEIGPALTLENFRYKHRLQFWALQNTNEIDREKLWSILDTEIGQQSIQRLRALMVLDQFFKNSTDIRVGVTRSDSVLWLKAYFEKSKQEEIFLTAIKKINPELARRFKDLRKISTYKVADSVVISSIAQELQALGPSLLDNFTKSLKPAELGTIGELTQNPLSQNFNTSLQEIQSANFRKIQKILESSNSTNMDSEKLTRIDAAFPEPESFKKAFKLSPKDSVENKHLDFCNVPEVKP